MESYQSDITYCCEICGAEELSEEKFRELTQSKHVEGGGVCSFCGLTAVSASELTIHVNQAHLDFLTPDAEVNMTFIDDNSPSEFNGELRSQSHQSNIPSFSSHSNSFTNSYSSSSNLFKANINNINVNAKVNGGGEISPKKFSHGHGSPLRSSLDLKLKNSMAKLQCPLCSFTSVSPDEIQEHVNSSVLN